MRLPSYEASSVLMSDMMSSPRSSSVMFIWNASANAASSMLMALAMLADSWLIDCCMAADTCVWSAADICCMYAVMTVFR